MIVSECGEAGKWLFVAYLHKSFLAHSNHSPLFHRFSRMILRLKKLLKVISIMKFKVLSILSALFLSANVIAADFTVEMKNAGADGTMVFEPAVLKVAVGDTVTFVPTDSFHNSETVDGLTPAGAVTWKGEMNKPVTVTLDKEGVYVYKCLPHLPMAMVGVVVAGEPVNLADIKEKAVSLEAGFAMNKGRLDKYLSQL